MNATANLELPLRAVRCSLVRRPVVERLVGRLRVSRTKRNRSHVASEALVDTTGTS